MLMIYCKHKEAVFLKKEEQEEIENEVEENFGTHKIINWVNHFFHRKEKIKANAVFFYALMGLLINVIFYMIFGR